MSLSPELSGVGIGYGDIQRIQFTNTFLPIQPIPMVEVCAKYRGAM